LPEELNLDLASGWRRRECDRRRREHSTSHYVAVDVDYVDLHGAELSTRLSRDDDLHDLHLTPGNDVHVEQRDPHYLLRVLHRRLPVADCRNEVADGRQVGR
jgi:hypothetical protein